MPGTTVLEPLRESLARSDACLLLAVSVVAQAFRDLQHYPTKGQLSGAKDPTPLLIEATRLRRDARNFLLYRLWEPGCLWREILDDILIRQRVLKAIDSHRRIRRAFVRRRSES